MEQSPGKKMKGMSKIFDYRRLHNVNRIQGSVVDIGNAGSFLEVVVRQSNPPEECLIGKVLFKSVHVIEPPRNRRILTAFRSDAEPGILLIVWREYPFYPHIEEGGDFMLQVIATDKSVKYLIIDNTYVRSGWMNEKMSDYLNNGWLPGLVEMELAAFCHLQAESYLGGLSFTKFGKLMSANINTIAQKLGKQAFRYFPIKTSDISPDGKIDDTLRNKALEKALTIIKTM